jgi:uncharacterized protein (DUF849 family)
MFDLEYNLTTGGGVSSTAPRLPKTPQEGEKMAKHELNQFCTRVQPSRLTTLPHPTPVEYRIAITDAIAADDSNPDTPMIPNHINSLIRAAFEAANRDFDLRSGRYY